VIIIFIALLMGLGVMFGSEAMIVDLGYGMGQQGAMQNAADAGAMAAGKLLAGSASNGSNGVVYVVTDNQVHQTAQSLADANHPDGMSGATYTMAIEYLDCNGNASGTPNFTASSDPGLVTDVAAQQKITGARQTTAKANDIGIGSAPDWSWSSPICELRVYTRVSNGALLASTMGVQTEAATASATARIYPTAPPTTISNVWPITHWLGDSNPDTCVFQPGNPCTFWTSQSGNNSFKEVVDLSRYSQLALNNKPSIQREQLFEPSLSPTPFHDNCTTAPVCYDATYPGNNGKNTDAPNWVANGWSGQLYVDPNDATCTDSTKVVQQCQNSRLEVYGGDMGNNIASSMKSFINAHSEGIDPTCNCAYVTMPVFFWKYGEQNLNVTSNQGALCDPSGKGCNSNSVQRVILQEVRRFRFNTATVSGSSVQGYYVSFYNPNAPPSNAPPNGIANTVALVG